jgi:hypothetical protein
VIFGKFNYMFMYVGNSYWLCLHSIQHRGSNQSCWFSALTTITVQHAWGGVLMIDFGYFG